MTQIEMNNLVEQLKSAGFKIVKANGNGKSTKKVDNKAKFLADKDQRILKGFAKKGIANVVLMDRNDKSKDFNVRPFGKPAKDGMPATGWLAQGRIVKKGEHGVQGLFHVSQTEDLPATSQ